MTRLLNKIRQAVGDDRIIISNHADDRLRERKIELWQVVSGVEHAILMKERPCARPLPVVEVRQLLADGTPVTVVWGWAEAQRIAKLVTVHFPAGDI
jgi:hypothetical protein